MIFGFFLIICILEKNKEEESPILIQQNSEEREELEQHLESEPEEQETKRNKKIVFDQLSFGLSIKEEDPDSAPKTSPRRVQKPLVNLQDQLQSTAEPKSENEEKLQKQPIQPGEGHSPSSKREKEKSYPLLIACSSLGCYFVSFYIEDMRMKIWSKNERLVSMDSTHICNMVQFKDLSLIIFFESGLALNILSRDEKLGNKENGEFQDFEVFTG